MSSTDVDPNQSSPAPAPDRSLNLGGLTFSSPQPPPDTDRGFAIGGVPFLGPMPQRPGPREPYIQSWPRPPNQWGRPDDILTSARNYPGVSPGPFMPQGSDVRGLLQQVLGGLGRIGSPNIAALALSAGRINAGWLKSFIQGREMAMKLSDAQFKRQMQQLDIEHQKELEDYGEVMAIYAGNPEQMRLKLLEIANKYNDDRMRAAINSGDPRAPERLLQERDRYWLNGGKYNSQTDKIAEGERKKEIESTPMPEEDGGAKPPPLVDPSIAPSRGDQEPPPDLLTPDEPAEGQQTGQAVAPAQQAASQPPPPSMAAAPADPEQAAPYQVAGPAMPPPSAPPENQPESAPAAPGGTSPLAGMPRVAQGLPTVSGVPVQQAPGQLRINPQQQPAAGTALPPARMTAPGFSSQRLDILARYRLGTGADLFHADDPLHVERNEAVNRRAVQMEVAINHILDAQGLSPDEKLRAIEQIHPGLAAHARQVIAGGEALPRSTQSRYNQILEQIVPRVDPSFTGQRYPFIQKIYGDYTPGGYAGRNIQSANRLAQAAAEVVKAARALPDGPIPVNKWNQFLAGKFTGAPAYTNFFIAWRDYSMEQVRLARGGQGAEGDIRANIEAVPPSASKPQIFQGLQIQTRVALSSVDGFRRYWRQMIGDRPMPGENEAANEIFGAIDRLNPLTGELTGNVPEALRSAPVPPDVKWREVR